RAWVSVRNASFFSRFSSSGSPNGISPAFPPQPPSLTTTSLLDRTPVQSAARSAKLPPNLSDKCQMGASVGRNPATRFLPEKREKPNGINGLGVGRGGRI